MAAKSEKSPSSGIEIPWVVDFPDGMNSPSFLRWRRGTYGIWGPSRQSLAHEGHIPIEGMKRIGLEKITPFCKDDRTMDWQDSLVSKVLATQA